MKLDTLLVDVADGIATITLNRPHKKNAMNPALHRDMTAALDGLRYDSAARVVLITGAGRRVLRRHGPQRVLHRSQG